MIVENPNKVRLCRAGSCCLTVEKTQDSNFKFVDDYGSSIVLTKEELLNVQFEKETDNTYSVSDKQGNKVVFNETEKSIFIKDALGFFDK